MLSLPQTNVYENVQYFYALNFMSFRQFLDETIIIFWRCEIKTIKRNLREEN